MSCPSGKWGHHVYQQWWRRHQNFKEGMEDKKKNKGQEKIFWLQMYVYYTKMLTLLVKITKV